MESYDIINEFLSPNNLDYLCYKINFIKGNQVINMAKNWYFLSDLDNMIDNIPSLRLINEKFYDYCFNIWKTSKTPQLSWEETILNSQRGLWKDTPTTRPPAFFHPLGLIMRDLRNSTSYSAQQYDEYDSQSTERTNNFYDVHDQKRPLTSSRIKRDPTSYGELSYRELYNLTNKNY
jgi:hypothetical protein